MANLIESMGYSLGKVHVGLIAYMCDLYREGTVVPLESFLQTLSVPVPREPRSVREWKVKGGRLDLAIFDGKAKCPSVIIEMKVDDYETDKQLEIQANATRYLPESNRLLVTLGNGEYYRQRGNLDGFTWVRLCKFAQAVRNACSTVSDVRVLHDWADTLERELKRRDIVRRNAREDISCYRSVWNIWNITLLGQLREKLEEWSAGSCDEIDIRPTCYPCGSRPDTILHLGWRQEPLYAEINNNGKLNVKIAFDNHTNHDQCRNLSESRREFLINTLADAERPTRGYRKGSRTTTLVSLPIGLEVCCDGAFGYIYDPRHTIEKLAYYLKQLDASSFH